MNSTAPLMLAVHEFEQKHGIKLVLKQSTTDALSAVCLGDYAAMYEVVHPLLEQVPTILHPTLYELMSDKLVKTEPGPPKNLNSLVVSCKYLIKAHEELDKCIADATSSSSNESATEHSQQVSDDVGNQNQSRHLLKHKHRKRKQEAHLKTHANQLKKSTRSNINDNRGSLPLTLVPQASASCLPISTLYDNCGIFYVQNRRYGTSFFALPDGTPPPLNAHCIQLFGAGHFPRIELVPPFQEKSSRCKWTSLDVTALKRAVKAHLINADSGDILDYDNTSMPDVQEMQRVITRWEKQDWISVVCAANISTFPWNVCRDRYLKVDAPWVSEVQQDKSQDQERFAENSPQISQPSPNEDSLTTHDWTRAEDAILLDEELINEILSDPEKDGWNGVAELLHTSAGSRRVGASERKRTPLETLRRWRFLKDESVRTTPRRPWTNEEDDLLRTHVPTQKSWDKIAVILGTLRSPQQCLHRYHKRLREGRSTGRWQSDEVARLLRAVKQAESSQGDGIIDSSWVQIARSVRTRSDVQCREKWVGTLRPGLLRGGWTHEEDCQLKLAIIKAGAPPYSVNHHNWRLIASFMQNGRDALQCQRRAGKMWTDVEIGRLKAALTAQKPPNFSDNEITVKLMIDTFDWDRIAQQVQSRTARQCRSQTRYLKFKFQGPEN